jgi:hypothetical protein
MISPLMNTGGTDKAKFYAPGVVSIFIFDQYYPCTLQLKTSTAAALACDFQLFVAQAPCLLLLLPKATHSNQARSTRSGDIR